MHYYPLGVLVVSWVFWFWELYLDYRQYKVYINTDRVPKELEKQIDHETFKKSKAYSIDKARFGLFSSVFNQIQSSLIIYYYLLPYFWNLSSNIMTNQFGFSRSESVEWEVFQSIMFTFITSVASTFINLPLSIYGTFVLEQKHGFNKQTAGFYAWDKLKAFLVSFLISVPVIAAIVYIVRNGGPYFFLYLWMFCFIVVCLITFFHGEIAALFDKFTPLPPGELRDKIEELAEGINFPLTNIFIVEGSKRSSHSNAYQSGVFNKKRIVIYDTLIEGYYDKKEAERNDTKEEAKIEGEEKPKEEVKEKKGCNQEEILAILCHELGHWHCGHLLKNLTFVEINYFLMFVIFSKFYKDPAFYDAFGFYGEMPTLIGLALLMMVLTPYNELLSFISTSISRHFEYEADNFAAKKGYSDKLKTGLVKLSKDNLGFPVHDELYSRFNHSHPTLIQRLKALSKSD